MSRAEADRDMAQGRIETLKLAVERHEEEANVAIRQRNEAENALNPLAIWKQREMKSKICA